ncbi:MAG: glucose-1-phosphate adenylyltransferase [Halanaerobiaceae bacterium]
MRKKLLAILLAGGRGTRLGELTDNIAKPALHFGGKYRLIDFPLSNCTQSGIDTVGVITQYEPLELNSYIGRGKPWYLDKRNGGVFILPPYVNSAGKNCWYKGTADAVYQNINFIERFNPEHVLVLSSDHIYNMDYSKMFVHHKKHDAELTISVKPVCWQNANRFGIMDTDKEQRIVDFEEKPQKPKSNLASMGIYIFKWNVLREYLKYDSKPTMDFGKDIIPRILKQKRKIYAYFFDRYWKDVGTIQSYWQANMDLLSEDSSFNISEMEIYSRFPDLDVQYFTSTASVQNSLIGEGSVIRGNIKNSVIFYDVKVGRNSEIYDSVILPGAKIGNNVHIYNSVIGKNTIIEDGNYIGFPGSGEGITLIGNDRKIQNKLEINPVQ